MKTKQGVVTSAKMQNTVSVTVHRQVMHPLYKKAFRRSSKFLADTNGHTVKEGDTVLIEECRPLSKNKRFKVKEIIKKAVLGEVIVDTAETRAALGEDAPNSSESSDSSSK